MHRSICGSTLMRSFSMGGESYKWPAAAAAAKSLQLCPTLCDPIDSSPPGSPIPGIFQARTVEWVAVSFSNAWKWKVKVKSLSLVQLLTTPWTTAYQAPPSMGFFREEYWLGVPLPSLYKWPRCPLMREMMKKTRCVHTIEHDAAAGENNKLFIQKRA